METQTVSSQQTVGLQIVRARQNYDEDIVINGLQKVLEYNPYKVTVPEKALDSSISYLISKYFLLKMCKKYPAVDMAILDQKTEITTGSREKIQIPVFARIAIGKQDKWKEHYKISSYSEVDIESEAPFIPDKIRKDSRVAMAYMYDIYAEALEKDMIGEVLLTRPDLYANPSEAELLLLWKPRPSDLKISVTPVKIDRDPILMLCWNKNAYLIRTWDMPNEEPFMQFLKQFISQQTLDDVLGM